MDLVQKKKIMGLSYFSASILLVLIVFGLFGLPFLKMQVLEVASMRTENVSVSGFEMMGNIFHIETTYPKSLILANDVVVSDFDAAFKTLLAISISGGVMYWLMLIPILLVIGNFFFFLFKKKDFANTPALLVLTLLSFVAMILYIVLTSKLDMLFHTYIKEFTPINGGIVSGVEKSQFTLRYGSGTVAIFAVSLVTSIAGVIFNLYMKKGNKVKQSAQVSEGYVDASGTVTATSGSDIIVLDAEGRRGGAARSTSNATIDANKRYNLPSAGFHNMEMIELGESFTDIVQKLGTPQYIDESLTVYWWSSARTRNEFLAHKLYGLSDSEIKISFASDRCADSIVFNSSGGSFANKNIREQGIRGKQANYTAAEARSLKESSVEMRFYDNSFIRQKNVLLKVPEVEEGLLEIYWRAEGLNFSDKILVTL